MNSRWNCWNQFNFQYFVQIVKPWKQLHNIIAYDVYPEIFKVDTVHLYLNACFKRKSWDIQTYFTFFNKDNTPVVAFSCFAAISMAHRINKVGRYEEMNNRIGSTIKRVHDQFISFINTTWDDLIRLLKTSVFTALLRGGVQNDRRFIAMIWS